MTIWVVQLAIVGLFALTSGLLVLAWQHGRLGAASIALFAGALALWVAEFAALVTEFHDANSFATCGSDCSGVHYLSAVAFLAPPLLMALSAAAMLVTLGYRIRARRQARGAAG
jgi:hypothetical protein